MIDPDDLATSTAKRLRCSAGPGTGKTYRLKQRVAAVLEGMPDRGHRIFAVTFTRQAAAQLKDELTAMATPGAESLVACTLHSHAFSILAQEEAIASLGRHPRPVFEYEARPFLHDGALVFGSVKNTEELLKAFDAMWARLQTEEPGFPATESDRAFNDFYTQWMSLHQAMSIGELIPMGVRFLRHNPETGATKRFDHILVDEYQDLNRADQELIQLLGENASILIVGDDDQSIYAFRHAHPEGIRTWLDSQPDPKDECVMEVCRRCGGNIVAAANRLIANNAGRLKGAMTWLPENDGVGEVSAVQWNTLNNEVQGIAEGIHTLLEGNHVPDDGKILVLVPRAQTGRRIAAALTALGRTDVRFHGKPDWSDATLQEALALLTLADRPNDRVAFRLWLGLGDSNYRRDAYRKVFAYCLAHDTAPEDVVADLDLCKTLRIPSLRARFEALQTRLAALSHLTRRERLDSLLPPVGATEELGEALRELDEDADEDLAAIDLLREHLVAKIASTGEARVNVMTSYAAKGLEAHTVIVTGLVNGLLPQNASPATDAQRRVLEEERRLIFVAATRARQRLVLSSFRQATARENMQLKLGLPVGKWHYAKTAASRFIEELQLPAGSTVSGDAWLASL